MNNVVKALFYAFGGSNYLKAHLWEHCLGAYFADYNIPYFRATTHPLSVYFLFKEDFPELPKVSELLPYIDNQKIRLNIEFLKDLDARVSLIKTLHRLYSESWEGARKRIEEILELDKEELISFFKRMYETKREVLTLSEKLPKISKEDAFVPVRKKISVPKLNDGLDIAEIAIRLPLSVTTESYFANLRSQIKGKLDKLVILGDLTYSVHRDIYTLQGGYRYLSFSFKTKAGKGEQVLDKLYEVLSAFEIKSEGFERWKTWKIEQARETSKKRKLRDPWHIELLLFRRILRPEDFEDLEYQTMQELHKKVFSERSEIYFLMDF
ncbi:MAG: hypothetical protein ACOC6Q_01585 [Patescibacteria group bacterium]